MKKIIFLLTAFVALFGISVSAHALLLDRGNGLIYDTDLDITWLQDANYAMTSGYDADGLMTWTEADAWARNLVFAGYDDFRLPTFDNNNPRPETATSANEIGSLLMILTDGWTHYVGSETDISPFYNLPLQDGMSEWYWTALTYDAASAWRYSMSCG